MHISVSSWNFFFFLLILGIPDGLNMIIIPCLWWDVIVHFYWFFSLEILGYILCGLTIKMRMLENVESKFNSDKMYYRQTSFLRIIWHGFSERRNNSHRRRRLAAYVLFVQTQPLLSDDMLLSVPNAGYGKMPGYEHIFTDFLLSLVQSKLKRRSSIG